VTRLSTLLDEIDSGAILLPEFQRGYVWKRASHIWSMLLRAEGHEGTQ
jgi:hypothetical protein